MSNVYGLDPGTEQSALVTVSPEGVHGEIMDNETLLCLLRGRVSPGELVVELVESYGMAVGREVFATVQWTGRFIEAWDARFGTNWSLLPRRDVKLTLCGSMKAKDANIRRALLDRYGGDASAKKGGPLYGLKSHMWSALALAVTHQQQQQETQQHGSQSALRLGRQ